MRKLVLSQLYSEKYSQSTFRHFVQHNKDADEKNLLLSTSPEETEHEVRAGPSTEELQSAFFAPHLATLEFLAKLRFKNGKAWTKIHIKIDTLRKTDVFGLFEIAGIVHFPFRRGRQTSKRGYASTFYGEYSTRTRRGTLIF